MVISNRTRASSFSLSLPLLFLFFSVMKLCVWQGLPVSTFLTISFILLFFSVCVRACVCRCMSWGFEIYKAGLLMQSMPTSGKHLGGKVTPCCLNSSRDRKKNKLETVEMQIFFKKKYFRFFFCFVFILNFLFWVLRHYCGKKTKKVVVQYLIQTCTTSYW